MSEFPECMEHRNDSMTEGGRNGQVCHRIAGHGGNCLFDGPPEFEPPRYPTNFRTNSDLGKLTRSTVVMPNLKPNPWAEA